jgi:hypothetical protein
MELKTRRERIQHLTESDGARFAIFLRNRKGNKAEFTTIHKSHAEALDVARLHAADMASQGKTDYTFYVVQIAHKVGIESGKIVDYAIGS